MVVTKSEMVAAIRKVVSVIPKSSTIDALMGALVKDGYLIATNTEISVQVKLEAGAGEKFILPTKALDMICKLPDGDIRIDVDDKDVITIIAGRIKNKIQTVPANQFAYDDIRDIGDERVVIDADKLVYGLSHVAFAADSKAQKIQMQGVYMQGDADKITMAALDGHKIARMTIPSKGVTGMKIIVPKQACEKLAALELRGDVELSYDQYAAVFKDEGCIVHTRLIGGVYFDYEKMFIDSPIRTSLYRRDFSEALLRANTCINSEKSKVPVVIDITGHEMEVSIVNSTSDYHEVVQLSSDVAQPIRIGFNPKLIYDSLKFFSDEEVTIGLTSPRSPMFLSEENTDMQVLILPVAIPTN